MCIHAYSCTTRVFSLSQSVQQLAGFRSLNFSKLWIFLSPSVALGALSTSKEISLLFYSGCWATWWKRDFASWLPSIPSCESWQELNKMEGDRCDENTAKANTSPGHWIHTHTHTPACQLFVTEWHNYIYVQWHTPFCHPTHTEPTWASLYWRMFPSIYRGCVLA